MIDPTFFSAICVIAIIAVFYLALMKEAWLKWLGILILLLGMTVYWKGYDELESSHWFALSLRSLLSSAEMFIGGNDLVEVNSNLKEKDSLYMIGFATVHFMAILVTVAAAAAALGSRAKFWIRLLWVSFFGIKKKTYVFFGATEPALLLAKDIEKNRNEKSRFIFVQMPREEKESGESHSFHFLLGMFNYRRHILKRIREIGNNAHLAIATHNFLEFDSPDFRYYDETANFGDSKDKEDFMNPNGFKKPFDLFNFMGLSCLRSILLHRCDGPVNVFFLNEDTDFNLYSLDVLSSDPYFSVPNQEKVIVYCQARRDNINLLEEHRFLQKRQLEVHVVDSSYLAVFYLKNNLEHLPVSFVQHEQGVVTSAFNSMIIGFGETGQEALQFLYEYGSFIGPNGSRSPFHCTVWDKHMDEIEGTFKMRVPALVDSPLVEFAQMDAHHPQFWQKMKDLISDMNYIVVSLGNDEDNISLAINLYEFASRERANRLDNFTIYVRSYHASSEKRLNSIAQHYNLKNNSAIKDGKQGIVIFGELDEIYTFDRVSFEDEEENRSKEVKDFYDVYRKLAGDCDWDWESRRRRWLEPTRESSVPLLFRYRGLNRMESQDYANWMHIKTKLALLDIPYDKDRRGLSVLPNDKKELVREMCLSLKALCGKDGEKAFANPGCSQEVWNQIETLSKTEHLRWIAAHEMMGYTYGDVKSEDRDVMMKHSEMKPWETLSDRSRLFDAQVVYATLVTQYSELRSL